jgi:diguanylate cyclase (GGDEF)-like protein
MAKASAVPIHWVVRMNYKNRTGSWLIAFAVLATHFGEHAYGLWAWLFMGLQFLVYPHLVYLRARHARDPLAAELQNMLLDNFCFGVWTAVLGFPLWISYALFIGGCINMMAFSGAKGVLQALAAIGAGAVLAIAIGGARFDPDTSLLVSVMSMACLSIYLILFARSAHTRTVALHETRGKLRQSEAGLQRQIEAIQSLQAQLTEQANRDPLTGLYNRRYLNDSLQREFDRCARDGAPISLLLVDLDHFKLINDRHGHSAGDEVLRQVSTLLMNDMRSSDICCRYGGEEFLLVLPHVGLDAALERAEHCRSHVAAHRWLADEQALVVTLSVGVACASDARMTPAALIHLADQALYRAKAEGRNRVCLSGS